MVPGKILKNKTEENCPREAPDIFARFSEDFSIIFEYFARMPKWVARIIFEYFYGLGKSALDETGPTCMYIRYWHEMENG